MLSLDRPETIPGNWRCTRINDVAQQVSVRAGSSQTYPVLSVTKHKGIIPANEYFNKPVHGRDTAAYKVVRNGQLAYATIHLDEGSIGILRELESGIVSPMYTVFEASPAIEPQYLLAVLKSPHSAQLFKRISQGSVNRRASISFDALGQLFLVHPSLAEQRKIAAILSSLDENIDKTEIVIKELLCLRLAMMRELFTRGFQGENAHSKMVSEVGEIPGNWRTCNLNEALAEIEAGWSPACEQRPATVDEWGVLKVSSVTHGGYSEMENKALPHSLDPRPELEVRAADVLVARASGVRELVGLAAFVWKTRPRLMLSDKILRLCPVKERIDPLFLYFAMNLPATRRQVAESVTGSHMRNISQKALGSVVIPLPSLEEQRAVATALGAVVRRELAEASLLAGYRNLKSALLSALLSGQIRVKPAEAPA